MDVFGLGAITQGFTNLFGNIWAAERAHDSQEEANATNIQIAKENNAANLKLAQQQNDWNLAQWQRQNEYNSPKAQMERFAAAGLNPNLIYGQGNSGNASPLTSANLANQQAAHVEADKISPALFAQAFAAVGDLSMKILQGRAMQSQIDKTKAETDKIVSDIALANEAGERARNLYQGQYDLQQAQVSKTKEEMYNLNYNRLHLSPAQLDNIRTQNRNLHAQSDLTYQRAQNLMNGLPIDGGSVYERLITSALNGATNGKVLSPEKFVELIFNQLFGKSQK